METITLTFGTNSHVNFSVSSTQNNYEKKNLLPIVMEEDGPFSYTINIFGADNLESVFPVFQTTETSFFKFEHGDKYSSCIKVSAYGQISSFPYKSQVYGLEILNEKKQNLFEKYGGHKQKNLNVWFGIDEGEDECGIYFTTRRTETDGCTQIDGPTPINLKRSRATIALNNTSCDRYKSTFFTEPKNMNKRTFHFCFKKSNNMMDNLYLN